MSDVLIRDLLELAFVAELPCEHPDHDADAAVHDGAATHIQLLACGHTRGLRCARWVAFVVDGGRVKCPDCPGEPRLSVADGSIWFVKL